MEEAHLAPEPPVVALLGFLEPVQVGLELLVVRPGGAVDALEHLVPRIAPPVGARDLEQLEGTDPAGGRQVRPAAEIDEVSLPVEGDGLALRNRRDQLRLVELAHVLEHLDRVVARPDLALHRLVRLLISAMRASIFSRSAGVKGSLRAKS